MRRALSLAILLVVVTAPGSAAAQGEEPSDGSASQVVLAGDVRVPRGEVSGEIVVFRGSALIEGVVDGDVVVLRGPITVAGQVRGDVVAVSGKVKLRSTAQVGGSVIAGDAVDADPGAQVVGGVTQGVRYTLGPALTTLGALLVPVAMAVSVLLLGLLWLAFAPRSLEPVAQAGREAALASIGWGLVSALAVPAGAAVLAASVLGLPLAIAIALGWWFLSLTGLAATAWFVGRLAVPAPRSRAGAWFAGWAITAAVGLVPFLNVAWWVAGSMFGVGMLVVAVWRARRATPGGAVPTRGGRHRAGRSPAAGTLGGDASDVPPAGLG